MLNVRGSTFCTLQFLPPPPPPPQVPVSATPGRTKHFQTLHVSSEQLVLCDCPGLVFPSLVSTKAEMVVCGILPIDQMRDHIPPVSLVTNCFHGNSFLITDCFHSNSFLVNSCFKIISATFSVGCYFLIQVCQRIPRSVLKRVYGIRLPQPSEGEDPTRYPTALELLSAYGCECMLALSLSSYHCLLSSDLRGYMTSHGLPDCPRSARYILKDYVKARGRERGEGRNNCGSFLFRESCFIVTPHLMSPPRHLTPFSLN